MLRKNTFVEIARNMLGEEITSTLYDFLSNRRCVVEVGNARSSVKEVPLGCVQGSVLGPKLFNVYTSKIGEELTTNSTLTSYADDSYVTVAAGTVDELKKEAEECIKRHVMYLKKLGMVVNHNKKEIIHLSRRKPQVLELKIEEESVKTLEEMKVLGITMDNRLAWTSHIHKTINKLGRLTGSLKFLRRRLTEPQFMKVLTSQYYGICFYNNQAWLGEHTRKSDIRKLDSTHYRLLRLAKCDYKRRIPREDLDDLGRARPETWMKFSTVSLTAKVIRDQEPKRLYDHLMKTQYYERRYNDRPKFFDASKNKGGFQAIGNRIGTFYSCLTEPLTLVESNDALRTKLKRCFKMKLKNENIKSANDAYRSSDTAQAGGDAIESPIIVATT
jgi:hypothetical protein